MIKYEDIVKRISFIKKRKIKNEEKIKFLIEENNTLSSNLKILNQKKEMLEKMDQDLADLIPDKKRLQTISVYSCSKQRLWISKDKYLGNIPKTLGYQKSW